jgi:hypothetical protein
MRATASHLICAQPPASSAEIAAAPDTADLRAAADGLPEDPRAALSYGGALLDAYQHDGTEQRLAEAIGLLESAGARNPAGSVDYRAAQTPAFRRCGPALVCGSVV